VWTGADAVTAALLGVLVGVLLGVLVIMGAVMGVRAWLRSRISADEWERRRRQLLLAKGKMGDANLLDVHDNLLLYSYSVRGVEYTASQDISRLREYLPPDAASLAGHVLVRYDARNPANSIVLAEQWSGLRSANSQSEGGSR
jgi:uncharacterized membrane protein YciS (DUF1049 family)